MRFPGFGFFFFLNAKNLIKLFLSNLFLLSQEIGDGFKLCCISGRAVVAAIDEVSEFSVSSLRKYFFKGFHYQSIFKKDLFCRAASLRGKGQNRGRERFSAGSMLSRDPCMRLDPGTP